MEEEGNLELAVTNIFSKRNKKMPDVYTYDSIPTSLRIQVAHIWNDTIDRLQDDDRMYRDVIRILRKEYGVFRLPYTKDYHNDREELIHFFLQEKIIGRVIDVV